MKCKGDEENLKKLLGKEDSFHIHYGGYEIMTKEPEKFKWAKVMEWLLYCDMEVTVHKEKKGLKITAKHVL